MPTLTENLEIAAVVIGAGITGLTAALRMSDAGLKVVVLEGNSLCGGVTGGTTAHITELVDLRYHQIAKDFGGAAAQLVAESSRAAIDHIAGRVSQLGISCDFQRVPGYLYTEDASAVDELTKEHAGAREAGLDASLEVPRLPFSVAGALKLPDQARFHPRDYCVGLANELLRRGVRIYEHTRVTDVKDGEPVVLTTESGATIRASSVFCATHVPLNFFLVHSKLGHYQSYAMSFDLPDGDAIEDGLFNDTADPYHYTRLATVDGKRQLIVGGEDHKTGEVDRTQRSFDSLLSYAQAHYAVGEPNHHWSAQVVEPVDGLPYIGRNAGNKHVYIATGMSGNGITFGTVAAMLVTDLITGVESPWASLYKATRLSASSLGEMVRENASIPKNLLGFRHQEPSASDPAEIPPGEGRTLHVGGKHLAVYRDPDGELHALSARCTHMHCVVRFNQAERTWDCPCHGARFGTDGHVIDGPATVALEKHEIADKMKIDRAR